MSGSPARIRVLVVDDSAVMRELIVHILSTDAGIEVIGTAANGKEAVELVTQKNPDVITMDLHMPRMDGIEAVRTIMESTPTPIVVVTGSSVAADAAETFRALEAGAVALAEKPLANGGAQSSAIASKLVQTVKLMAEVKVVRRWRKRAQTGIAAAEEKKINPSPAVDLKNIQLIVIGASTGGPLVLQKILMGLAGRLAVPVLVVQHIANGFTGGFADWLQQSTQLRVTLASDGEILEPGRVYIAPEECHTEIKSGLRVKLSNAAPENGHRPSVSHLFRSTASVLGGSAVAVLLSGMGRDGARELKQLRDCGALTIAQDLQTAVVPGMPGEAIRLDAAVHVLAPEKIADMVLALTHRAR